MCIHGMLNFRRCHVQTRHPVVSFPDAYESGGLGTRLYRCITLVPPTFLCSSLWPHSVLSDAVGVSVGRVRGRVERMDPALVGKEEEPSASEGKR